MRPGHADPQLALAGPEARASHGEDTVAGQPRLMAEPWNGSWNGMPRNSSAISASGAIRRGWVAPPCLVYKSVY